MQNKVLVIGSHPISSVLVRQYCQRGDKVDYLVDCHGLTEEIILSVQEICLLASSDKMPITADDEIMEALGRVAAAYQPEENSGRKLLCHLLLRSNTLLHMIRLEGFKKDIEEKLEIYPFTIEDLWSQKLALGLDYKPITIQSEQTIHLVIFGMSKMAELTAINAAHVCHFPNYIKNHSQRTRITIIDERIQENCFKWIQKYQHLFDNCFYRFVDPQKRPTISTFPPCQKQMEDFVDVEWEFVSTSPYDEIVRNKIKQWALSSSQLLTIVYANDNTEQNLTNATHLPDEIEMAAVPIYVYMQSDYSFLQINHTGKVTNIRPFGMSNYGYDINIPFVQMAKTVNYIYNQCRVMESNDGSWKLEYTVEVNAEERERLWNTLPFNKRMSSIYNAMTIGIKMRSMGFKEDEWEKFYDISQDEIEILAQVEHNRWSVEELILGWRPCSAQEQLEVEADIKIKEELKKRKIHYDLRPYRDLRPDASGKPVQIYDRCLSACIPLIAKESKGGER